MAPYGYVAQNFYMLMWTLPTFQLTCPTRGLCRVKMKRCLYNNRLTTSGYRKVEKSGWTKFIILITRFSVSFSVSVDWKSISNFMSLVVSGILYLILLLTQTWCERQRQISEAHESLLCPRSGHMGLKRRDNQKTMIEFNSILRSLQRLGRGIQIQ